MVTRLRWLCLPGFCAAVQAQVFDDLVLTRNMPQPYTQLLQLKGGVLGEFPADEDPAAGLESKAAADGSVYYRDEAFGDKSSQVDVYAGRDGVFASLGNGDLLGGETRSRLELKSKVWPFYREGFYRGSSFVPVGRYEGRDYEAYLGAGRESQPGLYLEIGAFYGRKEFDRNEDTDPGFQIPNGYDYYGSRAYLEQNTLQFHRRTGRVENGFLLSLLGEYEWNDNEGTFGVTSGFETELPSALWRLRGRIEWYVPQSEDATWQVFATGRWTDEQDRVTNYEAEHPPGDLWLDAQLRLSFGFSGSVTLTPFLAGQYLQVPGESGVGTSSEFFYGGGLEAWLHFSETLSLNTWYSYLNNESRPSVSISEDLHGEHMYYAGMVVRFGGRRR